MIWNKTIMQNYCYLLKGSPESCNCRLSTAVDLEESHCVIVSWCISKVFFVSCSIAKVFFVSRISKVFCITLYPGTLLKLGQPGTGSGSFCIFSKWSAIATAFQISFAAILRLQKEKAFIPINYSFTVSSQLDILHSPIFLTFHNYSAWDDSCLIFARGRTCK